MPQDLAFTSRHAFRQRQRALRRSLSPTQQHQAALDLKDRLLALPYLARPCHIALYLPFDGEPDTRPLITALWQRGHQVALPVLHPFSRGQLLFLRYTPETAMRRNAFGIHEPCLDATRVVPLGTARPDADTTGRLRYRGQPARHGRRFLRSNPGPLAPTATTGIGALSDWDRTRLPACSSPARSRLGCPPAGDHHAIGALPLASGRSNGGHASRRALAGLTLRPPLPRRP
ncbi:5-formyltetrahydrofolate cyclo-ligase family protein [Edwardsiella tarda]|nr:5-formyltetrahydrofolate cyclo-ligase family protein [Edwardsiella tarda]